MYTVIARFAGYVMRHSDADSEAALEASLESLKLEFEQGIVCTVHNIDIPVSVLCVDVMKESELVLMVDFK